MYNFLFIILCSIFFTQMPLSSSPNKLSNSKSSIICAPQLQSCLHTIQKIPEARALLAAIQEEGPIQIIVNNTDVSDRFGAYWDPDHRIICISLSQYCNEAALLRSILFELHNASVNAKINYLDQLACYGKIDKASYVESMEFLEYTNSLNAAKIAEKGIQMGVFPKEARLPTYRTFAEHFDVQKRYGHSAHFAHTYDMLSSQYRIF